MGSADAERVDALITNARALLRDVGQVLEAELGLSVDQWRILRRLDGDGCSMGELGESLCAPAATVTRLVDGLVDRGLVYRAAAGDRRRVLVVRSEEGAGECERADALVATVPSALPLVVG